MLPFMVATKPEIKKIGLLEWLTRIIAVPKAKIFGGKLVSETEEFSGHENPAPRSVIAQVLMLLAFCTETNSAIFRLTPTTDTMGVESETRFTTAHVVSKLY